MPLKPAAELQGHGGSLNAIVWAPHSARHICSAGSDNQALIWDFSLSKKVKGNIQIIYFILNIIQLTILYRPNTCI